MSDERDAADSAETIEHISSAETSAISIIRSLPPEQRPDALKWFEELAKKDVIRMQILKVLKRYVPVVHQ